MAKFEIKNMAKFLRQSIRLPKFESWIFRKSFLLLKSSLGQISNFFSSFLSFLHLTLHLHKDKWNEMRKKKKTLPQVKFELETYGFWARHAIQHTTRNLTTWARQNYNRFYLHMGWFCAWLVFSVTFLAGRNRVNI